MYVGQQAVICHINQLSYFCFHDAVEQVFAKYSERIRRTVSVS